MVGRKMSALADCLEYMGIDTTRDPKEVEGLLWSDVARRFIERDSGYERSMREESQGADS